MSKTIKIQLLDGSQSSQNYCINGFELQINRPVRNLSAFAQVNSSNVLFNDDWRDFVKATSTQVYQGEAWLAGKNRQIECVKNEAGYIVNIPEVANFFIHADGTRITQLSSCERTRKHDLLAEEFEQVLLGPPLLLALAINQRFGMHASAVKFSGQTILFVGESGFGKSTLAKHLGQEPEFERLSDDLSILQKQNAQLLLNPSFPQLKLSPQSQQVRSKTVPLAAVILLDRKSAISAIELVLQEKLDAYKILLNHGVVAQLFDAELAKKHLGFVTDLAEQLPVYRLSYPNGLDKIKLIANFLKNKLEHLT